jgi:hypothetical protein
MVQFEDDQPKDRGPLWTKALFWKFVVPSLSTMLLAVAGLFSLLCFPRKVSVAPVLGMLYRMDRTSALYNVCHALYTYSIS